MLKQFEKCRGGSTDSLANLEESNQLKSTLICNRIQGR